MPWKLARWKDCDGGCCVRSPRFPKANPTPVDATRPAYMAGCRYQLNEPGGTSPDGASWRGGCVLYKELLGAIADRGDRAVRKSDIDKLTEFSKMRVIATEDSRTIDPRGALSWFQTCWQWPAATPTLAKLRDRFTQLGLWDGDSFGIEYGVVYDDSEVTIVDAEDGRHISIRGQHWHVEDEWDTAQRAAAEPACCHYWQAV